MSDFALVVMVMLLVALLGVSAGKLGIYFNAYFMLSKRTNADKIKFIAYSSFFKNHYNVILNFANNRITIEYAFVGILFLITLFGLINYRKKWITYNDFEFTYYTGDITEYYFVDYFVKLIIILTISFGGALAWWYVYYQAEDNKLVESEKNLKKFILDHIDYTYLAKKSVIPKYNIDAYLKIKPDSLNNQIDLFNVSLTVNIMNSPKFKSLSDDLKKYSKEIYSHADVNKNPVQDDISKIKANVAKNINDPSYYMIANYYHNDDAPLPTLHVLLYNIYANIKAKEYANIKENVNTIINAYLNPKLGNNAKEIKEIYDIGKKYFKDTIRIYKGIYDKYYTYYVYNILITNFLIIYVFLILIYIWIKKGASDDFFTFDTEFRKYGMFLIAVYYTLTCPAILFGIT